MLVETPSSVVGQVNRRAAAILAPLLEGDIIGTELKLNQEADGRRCKVLYIYALLGVGDNNQVRPALHLCLSAILVFVLSLETSCFWLVLESISGN